VQARELIALEATLQSEKDARGVRLGVAAEGLEGPFAGRRVGVNEELVFESASLIKVLILVEVLRQADSGGISLSQEIEIKGEDVVDYSEMIQKGSARRTFSVGQLAEGMITVSDNTATNLLIDLVGMERVNSLAQDLHLARTCLRRKMMDFESRARGVSNLTSATDMVTLLREVWRGRFLSAGSRSLALAILEKQESNSHIPAALPPGIRVAHKTGELEDIEHDAGIVILPGRAFALAILTQGSEDHRSHALQGVTASVYEAFSGGGAVHNVVRE
jgi:beta-lactamase class A